MRECIPPSPPGSGAPPIGHTHIPMLKSAGAAPSTALRAPARPAAAASAAPPVPITPPPAIAGASRPRASRSEHRHRTAAPGSGAPCACIRTCTGPIRGACGNGNQGMRPPHLCRARPPLARRRGACRADALQRLAHARSDVSASIPICISVCGRMHIRKRRARAHALEGCRAKCHLSLLTTAAAAAAELDAAEPRQPAAGRRRRRCGARSGPEQPAPEQQPALRFGHIVGAGGRGAELSQPQSRVAVRARIRTAISRMGGGHGSAMSLARAQ